MAVEERDPHSGHMMTGHEWNGIKELNTPVPWPVYFFLIVTAAFSIGYWILMPAWPTGSTYTKGLLGRDQRANVAASLQQAELDRTPWTTRIEAASYRQIQDDPRLIGIVRQNGRRLFGDNCAACHGIGARGRPGFPNLTTASWMWGGDPEQIAETIRIGINSNHGESRTSQMPAFGRDQMLPRGDIETVVAYVRSLSGQTGNDIPPASVAAGKAIFAANCVACHGEEGKGNVELGGPNLTDRFWTYGGDLQSVFASVWYGRQGLMPMWEGRLSAVDRKILAAYVFDQRSPER